jgi:hypothetical protein
MLISSVEVKQVYGQINGPSHQSGPRDNRADHLFIPRTSHSIMVHGYASLTLYQLEQTNLGYFPTDPSELPTTQAIEHDVVQEGVWATVEIVSGATSRLEISRANGDTTYNGSSLIQVYYAQARNELASRNYLVPYLQQALGRVTGQLGARLSAQ